jgi:putative phosphoesterase
VKVGVIADTHLTGYDGRLERILDHHFSGAELILHAGDLTDISVLDLFGQKEVRAVYGNTDPPPVRHLLCDKLILDVQGFRLGLIHGCGTPTQIEETITAQFDCVDCIIFGHTHRPVNRVKAGILYFNPGSATCNRFTPYGTVGVLDIGKTITGEIIALQDH